MRKIFLNRYIVVFYFLFLAAFGIYYTVTNENVNQWVQREINKTLRRVWVKEWPIQFSNLVIETDVSKLYEGQISSIELYLKYKSYDLKLTGPINYKKQEGDIFILFDADITVLKNGNIVNRLYSEMDIKFNLEKKDLDTIFINFPSQKLQVDEYGIDISHMSLEALLTFNKMKITKVNANSTVEGFSYVSKANKGSVKQTKLSLLQDDKNYSLNLNIEGMEFANAEETRMLQMSAFKSEIKGWIKDNLPDETVFYKFQFGDLEALMGEDYFGVDLKSSSLDGKFSFLDQKFSSVKSVDLKANLLGDHYLDLTIENKSDHSGWLWDEIPLSFFLKANKWDMNNLKKKIEKIYPHPLFTKFRIQSGEADVSLSGENIFLNAEFFKNLREKKSFLKSDIVFRNFNIDDQGSNYKLSNFNSKVHLGFSERSNVFVHFDQLQYNGIHLRLTEFFMDSVRVRVDEKDRIQVALNAPEIPLEVESMPMHWKNLNIQTLDVMNPNLITMTSTLSFDSMNLEFAERAMCLSPQALSPVKLDPVTVDIDLKRSRLKASGEIVARLFDGEVKLGDLKMYRLFTSVPEFQFNANWDSIKLKQFGQWLNFGSMDGVLKGHFKNAVFQRTLPTQFDFEFRLIPEESRVVRFSAQAMKNFVSLFADPSYFEQLPSFIDFLAFGWPSDLIGGYDIEYAGLSMFAKNGSVLVETFDPKEETKAFEGIFNRKKIEKHYILKGNRFKIPLGSESYPVVLDSYGLQAFVTQVLSQIEAIKNQEGGSENGSNETDLKLNDDKKESKEDSEKQKKVEEMERGYEGCIKTG
ncbi:MAG: hypothetical protein KDD50_06805 [Bdellovibrionales bacterium]|nr:hypothetical protein [Bdellovibrionales bacterium]